MQKVRWQALGSTLKLLRRSRDLPQKDIVARLGNEITDRTLRTYESGRERPSRERLLRMLVTAFQIATTSEINRFLEVAEYVSVNDQEVERYRLKIGASTANTDDLPYSHVAKRDESIFGTDFQAPFGIRAFAYPKPDWMTSQVDDFTAVAKAALVLLLMDRTETGCWAKTYLSRRRTVPHEALPLAGGSLGGTPLAIVAIGSIVDDLAPIHSALKAPLDETLTRTFVEEDGRYLRGLGFSEVGDVQLFEPWRHTAGALLTKYLLGLDDTTDIKTLDQLCGAQLLPLSWEKAIVARTLAYGAEYRNLPSTLSERILNRVGGLLLELANTHKTANSATLSYSPEVVNQWAAAWALVPFVAHQAHSPGMRMSIVRMIRRLLLAQAGFAVSDVSLFPSMVDKNGKGSGAYVFGTGLAVGIWRTIELCSSRKQEQREAGFHTQRAATRILSNWREALEVPATIDHRNTIALEGYLGWAGILIAASSLGIKLSSSWAEAAIEFVKEMNFSVLNQDTMRDNQLLFERQLERAGLLQAETIPVVTRCAARLARLP